jgi:hypothetical protein
MSREKGGRNFRSGSDQQMTALALEIGQGEYTTIVRDSLRRAFGAERHAVKRLASVANSNERTAKNWLDGRATPGGLHLLRLMATVPGFQAEIRRLTGMAADCDPEIEREISDLFRVWQRRQMERT